MLEAETRSTPVFFGLRPMPVCTGRGLFQRGPATLVCLHLFRTVRTILVVDLFLADWHIPATIFSTGSWLQPPIALSRTQPCGPADSARVPHLDCVGRPRGIRDAVAPEEPGQSDTPTQGVTFGRVLNFTQPENLLYFDSISARMRRNPRE